MNDSPTLIHIREPYGLSRFAYPVRLGVPFARGALAGDANTRVIDANDVPVVQQTRPLMFWPDGSVKWLLTDLIVGIGANEKAVYSIRSDGPPVAQQRQMPKLIVTEGEGRWEINTGIAIFIIDKGSCSPFAEVRIDGNEMLARPGAQITLTDRSGNKHSPTVDRLDIEESGTLRVTFVALGRIAAADGVALAMIKSRSTYVAGSSRVEVELTIHNPQAARHLGGTWDLGDPGSDYFQDLSLSLFPAAPIEKISWYAEDPRRVIEQSDRPWSLYQDSSGGEQWDSVNHVDRDDALTVSFRGYKAGAPPDAPATGLRAMPGLVVFGSAGWVGATCVDFWQNFPKALRWERGVLSVGVFPRECRPGFELQGGEQKRHHIVVDFGGAGQSSSMHDLQLPLECWVDPSCIERSATVPYFVAADSANPQYADYVSSMIEGPSSALAKREIIDEFGWRNFGELYADHEAVRHEGSGPFISHYNNQYDFIGAAGFHYQRTGDRRWYDLMHAAAEHTIDIDLYHTVMDRAAFNCGLFWHTDHHKEARTCTHRTYSLRNAGDSAYGGGPSNEHNYSSGLLLYHLLTGDVEARAAVLTLADWVIAMDDGRHTVRALFDQRPTGLASKTVSAHYHGPGRGAANSINALLDAYSLTRIRSYMVKADQLLQRCVHPRDEIDSLQLGEPEHRWSYLVFFQVLGKYLFLKAEYLEFDYSFHYARESLLHYARWMLIHEMPYKDVLHKVLLPTESWPAQDIRKCHVMHLAGYFSDAEWRDSYIRRAAFFSDRCLSDLLGFDSAYLTRPQVILAAYGHVHAYFQAIDPRLRAAAAYDGRHPHNFGQPLAFEPQGTGGGAAIRSNAVAVAVELKRLATDRLGAFKRRLLG